MTTRHRFQTGSIYWLGVGLGLLLLSCSSSTGSTAHSPTAYSPTVPSPTAPSPTAPNANPAPLNSAAESVAQTPTVQEDLAQMLPITAEVEVAGELIQLEVARTREQQAKGLMYRPALPDNRGMLFLFDPPYPVRFWMKNTPQPLDMVFLLNGEVKAIVANVPPCTSQPCPTYGPDTTVNQVIELRSGRAAELGLQAGDQLQIRFLDL